MRLNLESLNFRLEYGILIKQSDSPNKELELTEEEPVIIGKKRRKPRKRKSPKRRGSVIFEPSPWPESKVESNEKRLWKAYKKLAWEITNAQNLSKLKNYNKRAFKGYHLDHKVSIWYGFKNNLDPKLIGNISNLEFISCAENERKGRKCNFKNAKCLQAVLFY
jgi:hypothetical protein